MALYNVTHRPITLEIVRFGLFWFLLSVSLLFVSVFCVRDFLMLLVVSGGFIRRLHSVATNEKRCVYVPSFDGRV